MFTGDALGHVAFAGAAAALAFGLDARLGLFVGCVGLGIAMGLLGEKGRADDIVIGNVLAWVLGGGVFFLTLYISAHSAGNGSAGVSVLFGSIFGLSTAAAWTATAVALVVAAALLLIARPLLFATIDPVVAAARGVPVRLLALVGAATAEATQAVGALLLLGLLAAPAGTAQHLTSRPFRALFLSAGVAVFDMWAGLALSYFVPVLPPSFAIIAVATAAYALAFAARALPRAARAATAAIVALLVVALATALGLGGCTAPGQAVSSGSATAAPSGRAALVGEWRAAGTAGKPGTLSDLSLLPSGHFRYTGKNALGGKVTFGGSYEVGTVNGSPQIRLVYDDFPDTPTRWFYMLDGTRLSVSSVQGNLSNGSALVFTRR